MSRRTTLMLLLLLLTLLLTLMMLLMLLPTYATSAAFRRRSRTSSDSQDQTRRKNAADARSGSDVPEPEALLLNTSGCRIRGATDPWHPSVRDFFHDATPPLRCPPIEPVTFVDGDWLRVNDSYDGRRDHCVYGVIESDPEAEWPDQTFRVRGGVKFTDDVLVTDEYVRVLCYDTHGAMFYSNYHVFLPNVRRAATAKHGASSTATVRSAETDRNHERMNLLAIGVDSVSRLNFERLMPRTRRLLLQRMGSVEFRGFNKVGDNTLYNIAPMFSGLALHELRLNVNKPFNTSQFLWWRLRRSGYRTLFAEDAPDVAIFNYASAGLAERPAEFYRRPLSQAMEDHVSLWAGRHCFGGKPETQHVLDHVMQFAETFSDQPHMALAFLTRLTHDDVNRAARADALYEQFFGALGERRLLNNTVLLFFSDHGIRFGRMRSTRLGYLEERLPLLHLLLPEHYRRTFPSQLVNLRRNAGRLVSPYDVYETLQQLLLPESVVASELGTSLLTDVISEARDCSAVGVPSHFCACSVDDRPAIVESRARSAAQSAVTTINEALASHVICARLRLTTLFDWWSPRVARLVVVFRVEPGGAMYEASASLREDGDIRNVELDDVSRVNSFGSESGCVAERRILRFCSCRR